MSLDWIPKQVHLSLSYASIAFVIASGVAAASIAAERVPRDVGCNCGVSLRLFSGFSPASLLTPAAWLDDEDKWRSLAPCTLVILEEPSLPAHTPAPVVDGKVNNGGGGRAGCNDGSLRLCCAADTKG